jgi:uncharacterized membrane protein
MAFHPRWARRLLGDADFDAIAAAIAAAERGTSAEIRVHLERRLPRRVPDALVHARDVFLRLGMHRTAQRHGVLIYLAVDDRKLAIVGDEGIHARAGDQHWTSVRDLMIERLRRGETREAIVAGVAAVGRELARYFPRRPDDQNELSDEVSVR